jgi:hypothetical protein
MAYSSAYGMFKSVMNRAAITAKRNGSRQLKENSPKDPRPPS